MFAAVWRALQSHYELKVTTREAGPEIDRTVKRFAGAACRDVALVTLRETPLEGFRNLEYAAVVAIYVDRDVGPVRLEEAADIGGDAAILQGAVKQICGKARVFWNSGFLPAWWRG